MAYIGRSILPNSGIKGLDIVLANLNKEIKRLEYQSVSGLVQAGALLQTETETVAPITPLDLGNLKASWFVVVSKRGLQEGKSPEFTGPPAGKMGTEHGVSIAAAKVAVKKVKRPSAILGYSANYAAYVHEMMGATFSREGSGPKWLEAAFKRNKNKIIALIAEKTKIL